MWNPDTEKAPMFHTSDVRRVDSRRETARGREREPRKLQVRKVARKPQEQLIRLMRRRPGMERTRCDELICAKVF